MIVKGKANKKMERIRLAPPPPPRSDTSDASRRSMRQRTGKRQIVYLFTSNSTGIAIN